LDAGTTVHGHGTKVEFLNATMIETELRESVFGACDAFLTEASAAEPPLGLDTAASMTMIIFITTTCVLVAAFFVFRRSKEDRVMITKLKGLDNRDLGIDNPLYDAPDYKPDVPKKGKQPEPTYDTVTTWNPLFVAPAASSESEESSEDDFYDEPTFHGAEQPKGVKHGAKTMKRLAKQDFIASLDSKGVKPTDAFEMMFDGKQTREAEEAEEDEYMTIGDSPPEKGLSRKEKRAMKKAAKKEKKAKKKAGASYYNATFDSPLPPDGGYGDVDSDDSDDSRNDENDGYLSSPAYDTVEPTPLRQTTAWSQPESTDEDSSSDESSWGGFDNSGKDDGHGIRMQWE